MFSITALVAAALLLTPWSSASTAQSPAASPLHSTWSIGSSSINASISIASDGRVFIRYDVARQPTTARARNSLHFQHLLCLAHARTGTHPLTHSPSGIYFFASSAWTINLVPNVSSHLAGGSSLLLQDGSMYVSTFRFPTFETEMRI
jgi:hypothetical protein